MARYTSPAHASLSDGGSLRFRAHMQAMGTNTDDGFIIESRSKSGDADASQGARTLRLIALALDEAEALQIAERDLPGWEHAIVESGRDVRAQAARLGVEPGTSQRI